MARKVGPSLNVEPGQAMAVYNFHGIESLGFVGRVTPSGIFTIGRMSYSRDGRALGATKSSKARAERMSAHKAGRIASMAAVMILRERVTRIHEMIHRPDYSPGGEADRITEIAALMSAVYRELAA